MNEPERKAASIYSDPLLNPENQFWFESAAEERLIYRYCIACNRAHHPPRSVCPHCHSDRLKWGVSSGRGAVYSSSMLRRGVSEPYCIAYVTLDEGVTMMTNLIGFGSETPAVGIRVRVRFVLTEGGIHIPVFERD